MIEIKKLNKFYKSGQGNYHALRDIDLTLPDKGLVFIVGKSGSGKSTLLNVIGGLDGYDSGELIIDGLSTKNFKSKNYNTYRNTYIGFIFQEFNVIKSLSIYDNIALSLELHHKKPKEHHDEIMDIIEKVGLKGKENRRMNQISGGERQRVAIARALVKNPKVIIADEPTGNLDTKNRDIIMNILTSLAKDRLVLIVTHDREIASSNGDRIITIKDGSIINDETINKDNLTYENVNFKTEQVTPSTKTSFNLALKAFKLNKIRFILIILLFAFSLIFAGSTVNLYVTNSSLEYAKYQQEYKSEYITIDHKYTNFGYTKSSGFYSFEVEELLEKYNSNNELTMYKTTKFSIATNPNNYLVDSKYATSTERIISLSTLSLSELDKYYTDQEVINIWANKNITEYYDYGVYITDYVADCLIYYNYYTGSGSSISSYKDLIGKPLYNDQFNENLYILNIIVTDYQTLTNTDLTDSKNYGAFLDNLTYYNSIFVTSSNFNNIIQTNLKYAYDDVIYNAFNKTGTYENIKYTSFDETTKLDTKKDTNGNELIGNDGSVQTWGAAPKVPKAQHAMQVAISRGFLEKVLNLDYTNISFVESTDDENYILCNEQGQFVSFYVCGYSRIPAPMNFYVTGIIDTDECLLCMPTLDTTQIESNLYTKYLITSYSDANNNGGFPIFKINDNPEINAEIYQKMLKNDIIINNDSFKKLLVVNDFIDNNLILFLGLFFVFCLFSILLIFNFIIINIKNSTKDIGIYMSLGMNGWKIALIYLFQVLLISFITSIISLIGTTIFLKILDYSFNSEVLIQFSVINFTAYGFIAILALAFLTPIIAVIFPLLQLSRKKPVDIIKAS